MEIPKINDEYLSNTKRRAVGGFTSYRFKFVADTVKLKRVFLREEPSE